MPWIISALVSTGSKSHSAFKSNEIRKPILGNSELIQKPDP